MVAYYYKRVRVSQGFFGLLSRNRRVMCNFNKIQLSQVTGNAHAYLRYLRRMKGEERIISAKIAC
jgi:hypothetical protein